jgi:excisionase family DNA binding protein
MSRKRDGDDGQQLHWLLTVPELAARWGVHQRTIRRMIKDKKIKVIHIGRNVRIHPRVADLWPDATI